jgi:hypothetical protein
MSTTSPPPVEVHLSADDLERELAADVPDPNSISVVAPERRAISAASRPRISASARVG